jgi:hypothetical protein
MKKTLLLVALMPLLAVASMAAVAWLAHQGRWRAGPRDPGSVVYAVSVRGSMGWGHRLERTKAELEKRVLALPADVRFGMLSYDTGGVYHWRDDLPFATDATKEAAVRWIQGLQPEGAGADGNGVSAALTKHRSNKHVVVFTNCAAEGGSDRPVGRTIREANTQGAVIDVVALGAPEDGKKVFREIAAESHGTYTEMP